jgi:hypothetical protein
MSLSRKNLLTKELKAAHATRLRSTRINNSAPLRRWARPPSATTTSCTLCRRYSTRATMKKRCFTSYWSRVAVSPLKRPPGILTHLWLWMFRRSWRSSWSLKTQTWCARCDLFESSRGEVLCVAKDERCRYHMQKVFLSFIAGKSYMTNPASATIDAKRGYFV